MLRLVHAFLRESGGRVLFIVGGHVFHLVTMLRRRIAGITTETGFAHRILGGGQRQSVAAEFAACLLQVLCREPVTGPADLGEFARALFEPGFAGMVGLLGQHLTFGNGMDLHKGLRLRP